MEFSDQDSFELEGPHEVRVKPPPGFIDDLALIGSKFDPVDKMERKNNPGIVELKSTGTPALQSSFGQPQGLNPFGFLNPNSGVTSTPSLPSNPLAGLSPEQLRQLALLQYLQNPFALAAFGQQPGLFGGAQQVVTKSIPVFRTETIYATSTIPLFLGAKKFFTTLTQSIGMTTITDYKTETQSVGGPTGPSVPSGFGLPSALAGLQGQADGQPKFKVVSEAVVKDTVVPTTILKEIKITLRNKPLTTTLTSTSMVSTQVTSYVTKTVPASPVVPTLNPFGGANPLAALLG